MAAVVPAVLAGTDPTYCTRRPPPAALLEVYLPCPAACPVIFAQWTRYESGNGASDLI